MFLIQNYEKDHLENGLTIHYYNQPLEKKIAAAVLVFAGSRHDPEGLEGLHHIAEHIGFRGTEKYQTPEELYSIERYASSLDAYTSPDRTVFRMTTPWQYAKEGLEVLKELAFMPLCRPEDWEAERKVILDEYQRSLGNKERIIFWEILNTFIDNSSRIKPAVGTAETIKKIKTDMIINMFSQNYSINNCHIIICGQISKTIKNLCDEYFGTLKLTIGEDMRSPVSLYSNPEKTIALSKPLFKTPKLEFGNFYQNLSMRERMMFYCYTAMMSYGFAAPIFQKLRAELGLFYSGKLIGERISSNIFSILFKTDAQLEKFDQIMESFWKLHNCVIEQQDRFNFCQEFAKANMLSSDESSSGILKLLIDDIFNNEVLCDTEVIRIQNSLQFSELQSFIKENFKIDLVSKFSFSE